MESFELNNTLQKKLDDLLDVEKGMGSGFKLPRVVVVGEESCGKSSTLERLVGFQFFPMDNDLCTRMPIELRMRHRSLLEIQKMWKSAGDETEREKNNFVKVKLEPGPNSKLPEEENSTPYTCSEVPALVK
eukprot:Pgem_evm1s12147